MRDDLLGSTTLLGMPTPTPRVFSWTEPMTSQLADVPIVDNHPTLRDIVIRGMEHWGNQVVDDDPLISMPRSQVLEDMKDAARQAAWALIERLETEIDQFDDQALEALRRRYSDETQWDAKIRVLCRRELLRRAKRAEQAVNAQNPLFGMF